MSSFTNKRKHVMPSSILEEDIEKPKHYYDVQIANEITTSKIFNNKIMTSENYTKNLIIQQQKNHTYEYKQKQKQKQKLIKKIKDLYSKQTNTVVPLSEPK